MNHDELQEHLRIKEAGEARRHRDLMIATLAAPLLAELYGRDFHPEIYEDTRKVVQRARSWADAIIEGAL